MKEYEILADILETFVAEETERLGLQPSAAECFELLRRLTRSARSVMRTTVDTFVSEYMAAIDDRNTRIKAFNQMASHELRSPIGTLVFAAAALEREEIRADSNRVAKIASTVGTNAQRLLWLAQNLERVSRLSDRTDIPSEQLIEMTAIAKEVARQLEDMASSRNVRIVVDEHLPELCGDPARLELAVMNLVSNAIKYSDPHKPDCLVEIIQASPERTPAGSCLIGVRDNGIGIPAENRAGIFERFVRAHAHMDAELGVTGSGLGLAIAADCITAMGGAIECESTEGQGSCFWITLPTKPVSTSGTPSTE